LSQRLSISSTVILLRSNPSSAEVLRLLFNCAGAVEIPRHAGAVAFSRTSDFNKGKYQRRHVLRRFGQVPDEYLGEDDGE